MNQGQITRLLMQHRTALYGYIYACVRNHADAEDILQNVSVAVTESIDRLTDEGGFLPWAREIARRRILAHRRTAGREQAFDPELLGRLAEAAERVEEDCPSSTHRSALMTRNIPPFWGRLWLYRRPRVFSPTTPIRMGIRPFLLNESQHLRTGRSR